MEDENIIIIVVSLIIFMGLITYMPSNIYNVGYDSPVVDIPDEFEAWDLLTTSFNISSQINSGAWTVYDFTQHLNTSFKITVAWDYIYSPDGICILWSRNPDNLWFPDLEYFNPQDIEDSYLLAHWNQYYNYSFVEFTSTTKKIDVTFQDYNDTRNNITASYNDGTLNCTISIPTNYDRGEKITARDLISALVSFRLPSLLTDTPPLMGFILSVITYVPIVVICYAIIIALLHGGG